jgi:hypothetical protein
MILSDNHTRSYAICIINDLSISERHLAKNSANNVVTREPAFKQEEHTRS